MEISFFDKFGSLIGKVTEILGQVRDYSHVEV